MLRHVAAAMRRTGSASLGGAAPAVVGAQNLEKVMVR